SVRFPSCAANDFSLGLSPATQTVAPGAQVTYTLTTPKTKGIAEAIALAIQDLPAGVTGTFTPPTATAGTTVTLQLTAAASAAGTGGPVAFTVIGKTPSAVHAATAGVAVAGADDGGAGDAGGVDAGTDAGNAGTDAGV